MKKKINSKIIEIIMLSLGMFILAVAIASILKPNGLITGGITGTSIILGKLLHTDYTIINYILSVSILIATYITLGKKEAKKIVVLSITFPLVLMIVSHLGWILVLDDKLLISICYAVLAGAGCGLILRCGYSTGGTDSIGKIIHVKLYPFISLSVIMTFLDMLVLIASIFVYNINTALYALVAQVVFLKTIDTIIFGIGNKLIKLEIISSASDEISKHIMYNINRGVSELKVVGSFTKESKTKLITICTPRESLLIKQFIASVDKAAFVAILPVSSVWGIGAGFDQLDEEE